MLSGSTGDILFEGISNLIHHFHNGIEEQLIEAVKI
jgi:hypothetical protein